MSPRQTRPTSTGPRTPGRGPSRQPRKKRRNPWPRRIITGSGLLAVVAVLVWGAVAAIGALAGSRTPEDAQSAQSAPPVERDPASDLYGLAAGEELTADGIVDATGSVRVPDCPVSVLSLDAQASATQAGSPVPITTTIRNQGRSACLLSLDRAGLTVTTGDLLVFDSSRCEDGAADPTRLLLDPGAEWTGPVSWDGTVHDSGCGAASSGAAAEPGTYRASIILGQRTSGASSGGADAAQSTGTAGPGAQGQRETSGAGPEASVVFELLPAPAPVESAQS
ncbi:hypothetical protein M3T53_07360 [Actinomyces sp. B33]|uniref:hypothetical protein n=1 Tax=Actinomyces sp. B33 TaxID=2942131 RepID=UPI0023421A73|nr:hypothetical protein [Actinomyces sp. B33]MDC4233522.1 hypothetical protein [Actinomyces sp. B33]